MKRFIYILLICIVFSGCRPALNPDDDFLVTSPGYDFSRIFETFWRGMDRNYLFWSEEPSSLWDPVLTQLPAETQDYIKKYPEAFWDMIYDLYKPRFDALGVLLPDGQHMGNPKYEEAVNKAVSYFWEMTFGLRDGHFKVNLDLNALPPSVQMSAPAPWAWPFGSGVVFPGQLRLLQGYMGDEVPFAKAVFFMSNFTETDAKQNGSTFINFPQINQINMGIYTSENYFYTYNYAESVLNNYFRDPVTVGIQEDISMPISNSGGQNALSLLAFGGAMPNLKMVKGKILHSDGGDIAYLSFNYTFLPDFLNCTMNEVGSTAANDFMNDFLSEAFFYDPNVKGIIIDVRGNTGGRQESIGYLLGRLIDTPLTYGYARYKAGEGRLDYTPWTPIQLMPAPVGKRRLDNIPIVLIVNSGSLSSAEFLTMAVKALPNGTVVGERTNGSCSDTRDLFTDNGGGFVSGYFIKEMFGSVAQFADLNHVVNEGFGIPPNREVIMTINDWQLFYGLSGVSARDKQLEAAIKVIDSGRTF